MVIILVLMISNNVINGVITEPIGSRSDLGPGRLGDTGGSLSGRYYK